MLFKIAQVYAHLYILVKLILKFNIPGLGWLLRRTDSDRWIKFLNVDLYYDHRIASCYGLYIINQLQEPETHWFLNKIFDRTGGKGGVFIDVGANIGAFVLDVARRGDVQVFCFEPSALCISTIRKSAERNNMVNVNAYVNLCGDENKMIPFDEGENVDSASVFESTNSNSMVQQVLIDDLDQLQAIPDCTPCVMLIDVEGYEPNVLRGATSLIKRLEPIIVFEYNYVSKRHFSVEDVMSILGKDYDCFRLRNDFTLDNDLEDAWNCVAIPKAISTDVVSSLLSKR